MPNAPKLLASSRASRVSRRALLLATAPTALLLGAAPTLAQEAGIVPPATLLPRNTAEAASPCVCGAPAGPMRVVGWAAHRLP